MKWAFWTRKTRAKTADAPGEEESLERRLRELI